MARRVRSRKPRRRAAGKRVARKSRGTFATKQMAIIQETIQFKDINVNSQANLCFSLSQFDRASALAPNFKWYKASKVEWSLEPLFNTYQEGVAVESVPYLYHRMNRTQDNIAINAATLQAMGAKPIKFTSQKKIKYVPNWCSPGLSTYTNSGMQTPILNITNQGLKAQYSYLASPGYVNRPVYLPTYLTPVDPREVLPADSGMNSVGTSAVNYNGVDLIFDQLLSSQIGTSLCARITATVTWVFKDPNFNNFIRDPVPLEVVPPALKA